MKSRVKKRRATNVRPTTTGRRRVQAARPVRRRSAHLRRKTQQRMWAWLVGWWLAAALFGVLLVGSCSQASAAMSGCIDATCRITTPDGGRGSGCVFEISQGYVYVLTAAHVVGPAPDVVCEFWRQGHQSLPLAGRVLVRVAEQEADAAIVVVEERQFGGLLPSAVPLAPRDYVVQPRQTLLSSGCAHGAWSTSWKGHALGYRGGDLCFTPPPAQGRSGSALFDAEGKQIVGLVRARTLDDQVGIACSLQVLYEQLGRATAGRQVQCGPNGCLPPGRSTQPAPRILPYRQEVDQTLRTWPTAPPVDLGPTNARLDAMLSTLQAQQTRAAEESRQAARQEAGPNTVVVTVLVLAALAVGAVVFFGTQSHTG
mgnify:FL=1